MRRSNRVPAPRERFRIRKLTPKEQNQSRIIRTALDMGTEFGMEVESRERLMFRLGAAIAALKMIEAEIGL